ncbi:MAG: hypothetical protein ISP10_03885 [Aeromicrobium sp.]|jgi:hypothetical protein|nr:hypothetical protein [Aeromicrobium sp.]
MGNTRPDISEEDIGMRAFQIRKAKAVERSLDRARKGLGTGWGAFTQRDLSDLGWIIGELWAFEKRADWEDLHFSKLTSEDVTEIIALARQLRENDTHSMVDTLERVGDIVRVRSV